MIKTKQIGLRLDHEDVSALKRISAQQGRTEQDILRDSLRMYVNRFEEQRRFIQSVERGWFELHSGLGEEVGDDDDFFATLGEAIRNDPSAA